MVFIRCRSDVFVASSEQGLDIALVIFFALKMSFISGDPWKSLESAHTTHSEMSWQTTTSKILRKLSQNIHWMLEKLIYDFITNWFAGIFFSCTFLFFSKFLKQIDYSLENTWAAASGRKNLFDSIGSWIYFQKAMYKCVPNKFSRSVSDISFYRYWDCLH